MINLSNTKIGTYQLAIVAQAANKPLYAVVESYKFLNLFPLSQSDLPTRFSLEWKDTMDNEPIGSIKVFFLISMI